MASTTQNLGLTLPAGSEPVQVAQLNSNFQKIDALAEPGGGSVKNSSLLANKPPEYYLTPVNLLGNSNFANLVAQAGFNAKHGTETYGCDRWISAAVTFSQGSGHATLTTEAKTGRIWQRLPKTLAGKAIAAAAKATGTGTVYVGIYYVYNGTIASISKSVVAPNDVVIFCAGTIPAGATEIEFRIYPAYDDAGGSCAVEWAALYEGEYTAETLPPYVPRPYAVELAECQRYYQKYSVTNTIPIMNGVCISETSARFGMPINPMRTRPTATFITPTTTIPYITSNGTRVAQGTLSYYTAYTKDSTIIEFIFSITGGTTDMPVHLVSNGGIYLELSADMGKGE